MVETFNKWFKFIDDGDVADLVDLVESLDSVLDELSQVDRGLNGIRDALDDNGVICTVSSVKEIPCSLEVSADSYASSDSDFIGWKGLLSFFDSSICVCHLVIG